MLSKPLPAKSITVIIFAVPLLGLLPEADFLNGRVFSFLSDVFSALDLRWIFFRNSDLSGLGIFNILAYLLLLLGAVLYIWSKHRETRLIRFVFSAIFLNKTLFAVFAIYTLPFTWVFIKNSSDLMSHYIFYFILRFAWILLAYKVLTFFSTEKPLDVERNEYGDTVSLTYTNAALSKRFINLLIDLFLAVLIFSTIVASLIRSNNFDNIVTKLQALTNEKIALVIVVIVCRSIYYLFFEFFIGATPGKMLTETRVITKDGAKPDFKTTLVRTVSRSVPFESFSTFAGGYPWHDRWSSTSVVNEKQIGVDGKMYFIIIPLGLFLWQAGVWAENKYKVITRQTKLQLKTEALINQIDHLNTNDFLELKQFDNYSFFTLPGVFLKAEKVSKDNITFSVVEAGTAKEPTQARVEKLYDMFKDTFPQVSFTREQLKNAIISGTETDEKNRKEISVNNTKYSINGIEEYFKTNIKLSGSRGYGENYLNIGLINVGWPADLISIEAVEGDITFNTTTPIHLPSDPRFYNAGFNITGTVKNGNYFKINLIVKDSVGRKQVYQVEGDCKDKEDIKLVKLK